MIIAILLAMKAAILYGQRDLRVEEVPTPEVGPEDILVRVKACGVCGSELHSYRRGTTLGPRRLGHEFSGEVVEVGGNVRKLRIGDRASALLRARSCGRCYWCLKGQSNLCPKTTEGLYRLDGLPGAFAEYIRIPVADQIAFRLPDEISYEEAVIIEPLTVAYHGVMRADPRLEDIVLVLGAGTIGLCAAQVCSQIGSKTVVMEISERRLRMAAQLDLTALDARKVDIDRTVRDLTENRGTDITVECAGVPATLQQALKLTRSGGKIVQLALFEEEVGYSPNPVVNRELTILGATVYTTEVEKTLELLRKGTVKARELITHEYPLERIKDAFETSISGDAVKVIVKP